MTSENPSVDSLPSWETVSLSSLIRRFIESNGRAEFLPTGGEIPKFVFTFKPAMTNPCAEISIDPHVVFDELRDSRTGWHLWSRPEISRPLTPAADAKAYDRRLRGHQAAALRQQQAADAKQAQLKNLRNMKKALAIRALQEW